jgi:hypothetical protein
VRVGLIGLLVVFATTCLLWIRVIPFDQAPDEWTHYHYNVRFLLDAHRLPVLGKDDRSAYETAHPDPTGRLVARYSYVNAPALNYVLYGGVVWAGSGLVGLDPITSARLLSLAWGMVFVLATCGASRACGSRPSMAVAATAGVALIPQVQFLSSYINQEAFSLAAAASVAWALANDNRLRTVRSFAILGLATGWLLTAKLQFWLSLPFVGAYGAMRIRAARSTIARLTLGGTAAACVVAVAGVWLGRNVLLYGSLTAQQQVLDLMRLAQGRIVDPRISWAGVEDMFGRDFFGTTFRSSLMTFDHMGLLVDVPYAYAFVGAVLVGVAALVLATVARSGDRRVWTATAGLLAVWVGALVLHVYNSLVWDYQPQGRYLFGALTPTAVYLAWIAERSPWLRKGVWAWVCAMLLLTGLAHRAVLRFYGPFNAPTVEGVRRLPHQADRRIVAEERVTIAQDGLRGVRVEFVLAPAYDMSFYGLEILDDTTGTVIRRAYVVPWEWRSTRTPEFRFEPLTERPGRVRLRVFSDWPGVHPALLRADCVDRQDPTATPSHVCCDLRY